MGQFRDVLVAAGFFPWKSYVSDIGLLGQSGLLHVHRQQMEVEWQFFLSSRALNSEC